MPVMRTREEISKPKTVLVHRISLFFAVPMCNHAKFPTAEPWDQSRIGGVKSSSETNIDIGRRVREADQTRRLSEVIAVVDGMGVLLKKDEDKDAIFGLPPHEVIAQNPLCAVHT